MTTESRFKELVNKIGEYGGKSIMSGDDYEIDYLSTIAIVNSILDIP